VPLRGGARLEIVTTTGWRPGVGRTPTFLPPQDRRSNPVDVRRWRTFRHSAYAGDFEGRLTLGLGVRARLPFRVFVLEARGRAPRVVIDVAHRWSSSGAASAASRSTLTGSGIAGVAVGSPVGDFASAFDTSVAPMSAMDRTVFAERRCVVRRLDGVRGLGLMVTDDHPAGPARALLVGTGSTIRTSAGIGVGSRMTRAHTAYGDGLDIRFDHYPEDGETLVVAGGRPGSLLVVIGDVRGQVVELRLGFRPEVLASEGCA
jgi:hypothetical protein